MKNYIELILSAIIIVLLIDIPEFLQEMSHSNLGKVLLLSCVAFLLTYFGKNAGILAALVVVIVFYKTKEGFFEGNATLQVFGHDVVGLKTGNPVKDDKYCEDIAKKATDDEAKKLVKWNGSANNGEGACVSGSGFKVREGAAVDPCNGASSDEQCKACSNDLEIKTPYFVNGKCSATEGFSSQEVDKLKILAAREGFAGYNGRQRNLKPYWNTLNITDEDRNVKTKAEKAKISASKEDRLQERVNKDKKKKKKKKKRESSE